MAEIYTRRPLFPGSSESDQLYKVCSVLGTPSQTQWAEGLKLASRLGFRWPTFTPTRLETLIPNASKDAVELMYGTMEWDPAKRYSAQRCLQHSYFDTGMGAGQFDQLSLPAVHQSQQAQPSAASNASAQPPKAPVQKDFPGNFLLNNLNSTKTSLNNTKGSCKDGSRPNTRGGAGGGQAAARAGTRGSRDPSAGGATPPVLPPVGALPPLAPGPGGFGQAGARDAGTGSGHGGKGSGSSRYLRMARYQPGMQQQVQPGAAAAAAAGSAGSGGAVGRPQGLPPVAQGRSSVLDGGPRNPGVFGGAAARMLGK